MVEVCWSELCKQVNAIFIFLDFCMTLLEKCNIKQFERFEELHKADEKKCQAANEVLVLSQC